MRVLQIHNHFRDSSGAEAVLRDTRTLCMRHGVEVVDFSISHPDNWDSPYSEYFAPGRDIGDNASTARRVRDGLNAIYSPAARRALARLLDDVEVDLAHVHQFNHYLSGSVVEELAQRNIPMVTTLHDYKVGCPSWKMFTENEPCRRCVGGSVRHAVRHKCIRDSVPASALIAVESARLRRKKTYESISLFLAPSRFVGSIAVDAGMPASSVRHIPLFIPNSDLVEADVTSLRPPSLLYGGRLDSTKGIRELIEAFELSGVRATLKFAGAGPLEGLVREAAESDERISYLGKLGRTDWLAEISQARSMIVPSIWEDNAPVVLLEAASSGTPVIGSNRGGVPELVLDGRTGFVVDPTDPAALADKIRFMANEPEAAREMGEGAHQMFRDGFTEEIHFGRLARAYNEVVPSSVAPIELDGLSTR